MVSAFGKASILTLFFLTGSAAATGVTEEWVDIYNSGTGELHNDQGNAIAVADSGNVYVGGYLNQFSYYVRSVDSSGDYRWDDLYGGGSSEAKSVNLDSSENLYVAGRVGGNFSVAKYNNEGTMLWSDTVTDGGAYASVLDSDGYLCATGRSDDGVYTAKYTQDGTRLWGKSYHGTYMFDSAWAIAIDEIGNVYAAGWTGETDTEYDFIVIKYNANGDEEWVRTYNGTLDGSDSAGAVVVDGSGNVYVTGCCENLGTGGDICTIKYDADGNQEWIKIYSGPGHNWDIAFDMVIDAYANVYVAGYRTDPETDNDICVIKYDTDGNEEWVKTYNGTADGHDCGSAMTMDDSGYIYVAGYCENEGTSSDICVIKYDADGNTEWVTEYDRPTYNGDDWANDIVVDGEGYVYITGSSENDINYDLITIKYRQPSVDIGLKYFEAHEVKGGIVLIWDVGVGLYDSVAGFNLYRAALPGDQLYRGCPVSDKGYVNRRLYGCTNANEKGISRRGDLKMVKVKLNDEPITGASPYNYVDANVSAGVTYDYWLEVLDVGGSSEMHGPVECTWDGNLPTAYALYQSRPNPARGNATIAFDLPESGRAKLTVYDIAGREVAAPVDRELPAGTYEAEVSGLAPGVYIYRLTVNDFRAAKKMVVVE
jgi:uncharacterized delta-60 repeat protein